MKNIRQIMFYLFLSAVILSGCGNKNVNTSVKTEALGYENSVFEVTTTFEDGKIISVEALDNGQSEGIGDMAVKLLSKRIVENQSVNVDAVTGATVSSRALIGAVEEAIEESGLKLSDFQKVKVSSDEDLIIETDVCVIGGGGAGLGAAVSAAQNGASVTLLEKTSMLGGNTIRAGGPYNAADPIMDRNTEAANISSMEKINRLIEVEAKSPEHKRLQDRLKEELKEYNEGEKNYLFDSTTLHMLQTYDGGDYIGKLPFIEKLCENALPTAEWLEDNGLKWRENLAVCPGGLWRRAHIPENSAGSDYIKVNSSLAEKLGVSIKTDTKAISLLQSQDGRVYGVIAEKSDGGKLTVRVRKAVIIATGGFSANKEMRKKYNEKLGDQLGSTNNPAITGDGIVMAKDIGASLIDMEWIQCLPLGNPETGGLNGWVGGNGCEYYYQINTAGKRFMAEDGRRDYMTEKLLEQEGQCSYVITDTNLEGKEGVTIWGDDISELVKSGKVIRADSIEELAEKIGVNPKVLLKTHEDFNKCAEKGIDEEFGRTLFAGKIDNPPFYASMRMPTVHHTMGGIEIDLNCHVLDEDKKVIPGLYAAGEVTGGIHGANRLGGNALVDIHVFGKIAGENAAKEK